MSLWLKWTRDQDLLKAFLCLFAHCTDLALSLVNKWILNAWKSWKVFLYLGCPSVYRGVHPQGHNYSNFFSFYSPNILKKFSSYILYILYLDIDSSFRWLNYPTFFLSNNKVSFSLNLSLNSAIFLCLWLKQSSINSSPLPSPPSPCWALVCQHQTGQWTMGLGIQSVTVFGLVAHDRDWERIWACFMSQSFLKTSSLTADPSVWLPKWTHLRSEQVYCQHSLHVLCGVVLLLFKTWQF